MEKNGLYDRALNKSFRKELADIDLEFFARFYLQDYFTIAPAPLHKAAYQLIESTLNTAGRAASVLVMPRGFAKTTICTLALPTWCVCFVKRHHIPIISDTEPQAKEQLSTVKFELEHNERIKEDFGSLKGRKWQEAEIETNNDVKLVALGAGMKIRGRKFRRWRPDLMILDDIENIKGTQSDSQRESLSGWFKRSVMRAGWHDTKVFVVGNFLHHGCLLMELSENPLFRAEVFKALPSWPDNMEIWDGPWRDILTDLSIPKEEREGKAREFFEEHREEMLQGAVSAWPAAYPVYDLMVIRVSEGEASFSMELQNDPVDPSKALFKNVQYYRQIWREGEIWLEPLSGRPAVPLSACATFGFTDPSLGRTQHADYSALLVAAQAPTNQLFLLEADIKRRPPERIMTDQDRYHIQYRTSRWGIEKNAFQAFFATVSAQQSMAAGAYLPVVAVQQTANKQLRIQSLEPDLTNGYILLPERGMELLKKQLREFPMSAHDDGPDALEGVRTLARMFEGISSTEMVQGDVHEYNTRTRTHNRLTTEEDPYAEAEAEAVRRLYEMRAAQIVETVENPEERESQLTALEAMRKAAEPVFVPRIYS